MRDDIKNVACIGSGLIGQGWTTVFAAAGYGVVMHDISDAKLKRAREQVHLNLIHLEDNGRLQARTAAGAGRARPRRSSNIALPHPRGGRFLVRLSGDRAVGGGCGSTPVEEPGYDY